MTLAERLRAVLLKSEAATQAELDSGKWSDGQCPYTIETVPIPGSDTPGRKLTIDKGDALHRATGANLEECLAKLEKKLGLATDAPKTEVPNA